jgi:hypothetical protein
MNDEGKQSLKALRYLSTGARKLNDIELYNDGQDKLRPIYKSLKADGFITAESIANPTIELTQSGRELLRTLANQADYEFEVMVNDPKYIEEKLKMEQEIIYQREDKKYNQQKYNKKASGFYSNIKYIEFNPSAPTRKLKIVRNLSAGNWEEIENSDSIFALNLIPEDTGNIWCAGIKKCFDCRTVINMIYWITETQKSNMCGGQIYDKSGQLVKVCKAPINIEYQAAVNFYHLNDTKPEEYCQKYGETYGIELDVDLVKNYITEITKQSKQN